MRLRLLAGRWILPLHAASLLFLCLSISPLYACPVTAQSYEVRGHSLSPLVEAGAEVLVLLGYYDCHVPDRGDVVTARIGNAATPLIKIIKGLPGDELAVEEGKDGSFAILVNGETLANSEGTPYALGDQAARMLRLYIKDYGGKIPQDAYLLLGDNPHGTRDSTRFGLIHRSNIEGRRVNIPVE